MATGLARGIGSPQVRFSNLRSRRRGTGTRRPGSFHRRAASLAGRDYGTGFVRRQRELASKRQVRFIVLRAPTDFRAPPRIELPDRFDAPGVEAVRIACDCRSATERLTFIGGGTVSHNGQQGQNGIPRPLEIDVRRRDAHSDGELRGISIGSGNLAR
jgi:hypothetical protein